MVPDGDVAPGDYVLIHVGYAIEVIDEEEALRTLQVMEEFAALDDETETEGVAGDPAAIV